MHNLLIFQEVIPMFANGKIKWKNINYNRLDIMSIFIKKLNSLLL